MVKYNGSYYNPITRPYNGQIDGILLGNRNVYERPKHAKYVGYFKCSEGTILVYARRKPWWLLLPLSIVLLITAYIYTHPQVETVYYEIRFDSTPTMLDRTLYCNVYNVAEKEVTVQFYGVGGDKSKVYLIKPQSALLYVDLDFIPSYICYDDTYFYALEVNS